jgi:predicted transcriptional regulator
MRKIQKTAIVGGTVAVLFAGGVAYAAWTSTGSGTGTATAGTDAGVGVAGNAVSGLFPTGTKDITVTVSNPNPYAVDLDSITADSVAVDATHGTAGCVVTGIVTADGGTYAGDNATDRIAAKVGDTVSSITRDLTVHMGADAADACKGAVFTVTYTGNAHSVV